MSKSVCLHFLQWRNHRRPGRFLVNQDTVSLLSTWRGRASLGLLGRDGFHSRIRWVMSREVCMMLFRVRKT